MASFVYDSFAADWAAGNCNTSHNYKALLTAAAYSENRSGHSKRSDVTNEVTGTNYTSGGVSVTVSAAVSSGASPTLTLTFGSATFTNVTLTSRKLVVYRTRGGAASADELVCVSDNGSDLVSSASNQTWTASTWTINLPAAV